MSIIYFRNSENYLFHFSISMILLSHRCYVSTIFSSRPTHTPPVFLIVWIFTYLKVLLTVMYSIARWLPCFSVSLTGPILEEKKRKALFATPAFSWSDYNSGASLSAMTECSHSKRYSIESWGSCHLRILLSPLLCDADERRYCTTTPLTQWSHETGGTLANRAKRRRWELMYWCSATRTRW